MKGLCALLLPVLHHLSSALVLEQSILGTCNGAAVDEFFIFKNEGTINQAAANFLCTTGTQLASIRSIAEFEAINDALAQIPTSGGQTIDYWIGVVAVVERNDANKLSTETFGFLQGEVFSGPGDDTLASALEFIHSDNGKTPWDTDEPDKASAGCVILQGSSEVGIFLMNDVQCDSEFTGFICRKQCVSVSNAPTTTPPLGSPAPTITPPLVTPAPTVADGTNSPTRSPVASGEPSDGDSNKYIAAGLSGILALLLVPIGLVTFKLQRETKRVLKLKIDIVDVRSKDPRGPRFPVLKSKAVDTYVDAI